MRSSGSRAGAVRFRGEFWFCILGAQFSSGASEVETGELNGLPCLSYALPQADVSGVAFLMDSSSQLTFNFAPMTDENYQAVVMAIISSIMPLE